MPRLRVSLGPRRGFSASDLANRSPTPNFRRSAKIVTSGSAGFTADGDVGVVVGTAGNTFLNVAGADPTNHLTSLTSAAVLNNDAQVRGVGVFWSGARTLFQALVRPGPVITVARTFVGLVSTSVLGTDTPGAGAFNGVWFRRSTSVPDTNWKCGTSNGAADTVADSGVVYAASTSYELQIELEPASYARFSINGNVVATITTTLPTGAALRMDAGCRTLEAVAKQFDVAWLYGDRE